MLVFQSLHGLLVQGGRERLHHVPIEGLASEVTETVDDALTKEERRILLEVAQGELGAAARLNPLYGQALRRWAVIGSEDVRAAARSAIRVLGESLDRDVSSVFFELAEQYYDGEESLQADANRDDANVWYLQDDQLVYQPVPTPIFASIPPSTEPSPEPPSTLDTSPVA